MVESVSIKKKLRPGKLSLEKAYAAGRDNSKVTITDIALTKDCSGKLLEYRNAELLHNFADKRNQGAV